MKDIATYEQAKTSIQTELDKHWADRFPDLVNWIDNKCQHYSEKLGKPKEEIFLALEKARTYSAPNYYQQCNMPELDDKVIIFETIEEARLKAAPPYRCPVCKGESHNPQVCDSGKEMFPGKICDWKSFGLFKTMGHGLRFVVKETFLEEAIVYEVFRPVAMEVAA